MTIFYNTEQGYLQEWPEPDLSGPWRVATEEDILVVTNPPVTAADIAAARWEHQVGGMAVEGLPIATDGESGALITGAALEATIDPEYTLRWKVPQLEEGRIELNAEQVIAIARAYRKHIQDCFDREFALQDMLKEGTITQADLLEGWPTYE